VIEKTSCNCGRGITCSAGGCWKLRRNFLRSIKDALDSAGLTLKDIQSVVSGSAPDAFDGVHMKGELLS